MLAINKIFISFFALSTTLQLCAAGSPLDHNVVDHTSFWVVVFIIVVEALLLAALMIRRHKEKRSSFAQIRLDSIMASPSRFAIVAVDAGGSVIQANKWFEEMLGYELEDIRGRPVFSFLFDHTDADKLRNEAVNSENEPVADRELLAYIAQRSAGEPELHAVRRNGTRIRVNLAVHIISDKIGGDAGFLIVAGDLTEKYRMQRELEESQKFLRSVIDAMPIRVFWKDKECLYLGCNKAFVMDTGLNSPSDIIGRKDSDMPWGELLADDYNKGDLEVMQTRSPKMNYEEPVVLAGGSAITVRTSKIPLLDVNDDLVGVLGMYEDITDYKRLQELVEKRIVSLTRYTGDPDEQEFGRLFDINEIQRIQDEFSESTNVSSVIVGPDGMYITGPSRTSSLCRFVMNLKDEAPCERCYLLTSGLVGPGVTGPMFRRCDGSGLNMAVSPIIAGGVHVASWVLGQVRVDEKSVDELIDSAKRLGLDPKAYLKAYNDVPCMTKEKFDSVAETAHILCSQLSIFATQNIQQARLLKEEKERTEEILKYHAAIEQIPDGVMIVDRHQKIQYANPAFTRITGYAQDEAVGMSPMELSSDRNSSETLQGIVESVVAGKVWSGRLINKRKDGTHYTEESVVSPVFDSSGKIVSCIATMRDITDELAREENMYHRQKMAAVGQLAGGVAHDFNNILQAVLGFSEILMQQVAQDSLAYKNAEQICAASKRAAALTRGLLALGRKDQKDEIPQDVDVNFMLHDSFVLLNLLGTEQIEIVYDLDPDLKHVCFSNDKLYQVVVNLVLNARDAMSEGGTITIKTENVTGIEHSASYAEERGDFVRITVADEGCGIPDELKEKIFNPFYTTKQIGKGSGLGLSIVYVLIRDCGGEICFESETGRGTKFFVYLPSKKV